MTDDVEVRDLGTLPALGPVRAARLLSRPIDGLGRLVGVLPLAD